MERQSNLKKRKVSRLLLPDHYLASKAALSKRTWSRGRDRGGEPAQQSRLRADSVARQAGGRGSF